MRVLEKQTGIRRQRLLKGMTYLTVQSFLEWYPPGGVERVQFVEPRTQSVLVNDLTVRRAKHRADRRLQDMLRYARSVTCRRRMLLLYFGEVSSTSCGSCDICLGRHQPIVVTPDDEPTLRKILTNICKAVPREQWEVEREATHYRIEGLVEWLVQEEYLLVRDPFDEDYTLTPKATALLNH